MNNQIESMFNDIKYKILRTQGLVTYNDLKSLPTKEIIASINKEINKGVLNKESYVKYFDNIIDLFQAEEEYEICHFFHKLNTKLKK